jgi:pimeloyl-ACP methyl ester carboxylesterase
MAVKFIEYEGFEYKLSYDLCNPSHKKALLFLHGWGSNKEVMKQAFSNVFSEYTHIYLDMPGFGASNHGGALHTKDYANIVSTFIGAFDVEIQAVFGHSFGGKVATLLAPKKLILLSSAGIVEKKPLSVKLKIALFKLLKPLGIAKFRKLFVSADAKQMDAQMYQTFKNVVDEDFSEHFKNFANEAIIFWGTADKATSLQSGQTIAKLIKNATFHPLEGDHYFFLKQSKKIESLTFF